FAIYLARVRNQITLEQEKTLVSEIVALPSQIEIVLAYSKFFASASKTLKEHKGFLYLARGINYPIALEGALKLKELCYMHAEGYAAGEMKHGPLALIDKNMAIIVIAPHDDLYEKTVSGLEEAKARGGQIISIGTGEDKKLSSISRHYLSLPKCSWLVSPILTVIPLQLMAYHMSEALGHDVDQPRNLAKSVTVE
ncbi:MAG: SIS domain-containing protein, partial [Bdellovibrionales bacterium]